MRGSVKWYWQRLTALILVPTTYWFVAFFLNNLNVSNQNFLNSLDNIFVKILMIIFFSAAVFHARLGLVTIYEDYFKDADLILVPDNDRPGREGMAKVGTQISSVVKRLRWLELPNLPLKGDASDWIENERGDLAKLRHVVQKFALEWDNPKFRNSLKAGNCISK